MNLEQENFLKKVIPKYNLTDNLGLVKDALYKPSHLVSSILKESSSEDLSILKSIYYSESPSYSKQLTENFKGRKSPILTLVTSVFKGDLYIEEFLRNTVSQIGFESYELILVDCASPGNEKKVIDRYMESHPNIRYIRLEKDPGLYEAWNMGVREAQGIYISNANLDDRKSPAYFSLLLQELQSSNFDFISSLFWVCPKLPEVDIKDYPVVWYQDSPAELSYFDFFKADDQKSKLVDQCLLGPFPIWKKSLHEELGFFKEADYGPSSDYEFWLRAVSIGAAGMFYKVPLGFYLRNPKSYARVNDPGHFTSKIVEKYSNIKI